MATHNPRSFLPLAAAALLALGAGLAAPARAQTLAAQQVASGLTFPVFVTAPPGDTARLFVVEQHASGGIAGNASIRIVNRATGAINAMPFLTITNVATGFEQGLLGLAFDPAYATSGRLYVNYTTAAGGAAQIVRYQRSANPDVANAASATLLLAVPHPTFGNHNAGWLGFGPDHLLYIATGDGGSGCDPARNAMNIASLLGKILRIDPSTTPYTIPPTNPLVGLGGARPEIWSYGLRNPWRPSFDRATGDLWIADVGQDAREEIDFQPAGAPPFTVRNYGWPCREGSQCASASGCTTGDCPAGCLTAAYTPPLYDYAHGGSGACGGSITGGYVYRGCAIPFLRGTYLFADYCQGRTWSFRRAAGVVTELTERTAELATPGGSPIVNITSFGEDAAGELYILSTPNAAAAGTLYRIVARCYPNCDGSTASPAQNIYDFLCFLQRFAAGDCYANCDASTTPPALNTADFTCFIQKFAAGCP